MVPAQVVVGLLLPEPELGGGLLAPLLPLAEPEGEPELLLEVGLEPPVEEHGVVGFAVTQEQRALTELRTVIAPSTPPHELITQFWAALWITAEDEHWHWKSVLAQLASLSAADSMQP